MRRRAGRGAAALILLPFLAGCFGGGPASGETPDLILWETYNNEEHAVFEGIVRDFEKDHLSRTGEAVRIDVKRLPFDSHIRKLQFAAISHTTPDIARVDAGQLIDLAYGQALLDLTKIDPDVDTYLSTFLPAARESVRIPIRDTHGIVRTGVYGIPDQITGVAVFYNLAMFEKAGLPFPPSSLEELEAEANAGRPWNFARFHETARRLTDAEAGQYGVGLSSSLWFSLPFFNAFGARFVELGPDGKFASTVDSDSCVEALATLSSLYWDRVEAGAWLAGAIGPEQGFINKKYAMIVTGPWNLQKFKESMSDSSGRPLFGVALFPEGPARRTVEARGDTFVTGTSTNVGGTDMAILRTCRNPRLAYEFLKYLTSPEIHARRWCTPLAQIPVNAEAIPLVDFGAVTHLRVFMDQMQTAIARPKIPRYSVLEDLVMVPQIKRSLAGGSVEEVRRALADASRDFDRLILADVNAPAE